MSVILVANHDVPILASAVLTMRLFELELKRSIDFITTLVSHVLPLWSDFTTE